MNISELALRGLPTKRQWAVCPKCRQKSVIYDNRSTAFGIWIKCRKCGVEYELIIEKGQQKTKT